MIGLSIFARVARLIFFSNGTGVRCHVAGWGKDEFTGSFQFIQHKVDLPLMDEFRCNAALKLALNRRQSGIHKSLLYKDM